MRVNWQLFWPLVGFTVVSTVTPGGATTLATASGAHFGYRRSIPMMAGIAVGLGSMAAIASAGLAGLLLGAPKLQLGLKLVGSAYLLWLAFTIARTGAPRARSDVARPIGFVAGIWMLWHNPKGWAMTLGAAASFTNVANGPVQLAAVLGVTFGLSAAVSLSIWCTAGLLLGRLLRTEPQWHTLNAVLGVVLALSIAQMWF